MEKTRRTVNPQFRLDVDGRLFKQTATNQDLQDTLIFDDLYSRFCIVKGDLPLFPNIGLKQHLYNFGFVEEPEAMLHKEDFETDIESQLGRSCSIDINLDKSNKAIELDIQLEGLNYPIKFKYMQLQNSIKVIDYKFNE